MKTASNISPSLLFVFLVIILSCFRLSHSQAHPEFLQCLDNWGISGSIYSPSNSSYLPVLNASIENRRFASPSTPKPFIIVTPEHERHIRAVVLCSKQLGIQIRTRGGGHDFEGLSYTSQVPFVLIDLFKLNRITIDVSQQTAWVQAGATLGQLYHEISKVSQTLAFAGGFCPTVGVGGHFSGGGFGQLFRKHGLAADNIIDARLINVNGDVLDQSNMGEDLFWAIRGGGGGSFGVIAAWKVKLVSVPKIVTYFSVTRTLKQNSELIRKWQIVAPKLPNEVYFAVTLKSINSSGRGCKTIQAAFVALFHGRMNEFLELFAQRYPELDASVQDCTEASWIQSLLLFNGLHVDTPTEVLASRFPPIARLSYKVKADYVREPVTDSGLEGIWNYLNKAETGEVLFIANGGRMNEIPEYQLPYPHRGDHLYEILYRVSWDYEGPNEKCVSWIRELYSYMTPYVSNSPRVAYVNYRDLDLGVNDEDNTNYAQIPSWGIQYFKGNFIRLMSVKTRVDPDNFFRHEQSIPTFSLKGGRKKVNPNLLRAIS